MTTPLKPGDAPGDNPWSGQWGEGVDRMAREHRESAEVIGVSICRHCANAIELWRHAGVGQHWVHKATGWARCHPTEAGPEKLSSC